MKRSRSRWMIASRTMLRAAFHTSSLLLAAVAALAVEQRDELEPSCSLTDEQIAAGTAGQPLDLGIPGCIESFNQMIEQTREEVDYGYDAFYREVFLDDSQRRSLSILLVREQLLGGWSSTTAPFHASAEHAASAPDAAVRQETRRLMRALLGPEQFSSLERYQASVGARQIVKPIVTTLQQRGIPLSAAQYQQIIDGVTKVYAPFVEASASTSADKRRACTSMLEGMNARSREVFGLFSAVVTDEQLGTVSEYYADLFERRQRSARIHEEQQDRDDDAICAIPAA